MPEDSLAGTTGRSDAAITQARSNRTVTPAVAGALIVLAASFALSVAFVLANGGLDLPAATQGSAGPGVIAGLATASPSAVAESSVAPSAAAESSAAASAAVSAEPSSTATLTPATPAPTASPTTPPTARPTSQPTAGPSSDRYALLTACPNTPDCWIYVVRQGDNLFSIARYFGVSLEAVKERNPWTATTPLVAGQQLRLPTPTR